MREELRIRISNILTGKAVLTNNHRIETFSSNCRCFLVVPQNAGFCIINETMYITAATDLSNRKAFVNPQPVSTSAPAATPELDQAAKEKMAVAFSEKSGMNIKFSAIFIK